MRKIKDVILFLLVAMMLFVFGGCKLVGKIYTENKGVALAEDIDGKTVVYNGYTYRLHGTHLIYNEKKLVAYVWTGDVIPTYAPIYVSDLDMEENIILIEGPAFGASGYYIQEGFVFPEDEENITLERIWLSNSDERVAVPELSGLTYNDLFEEEIVEEIIYDEDHCRIAGYIEVKGYEFLATGVFGLCEKNGNLYAEKSNPVNIDGKYVYENPRKIKTEYVELFKSAMKELKTMQEISTTEEQ